MSSRSGDDIATQETPALVMKDEAAKRARYEARKTVDEVFERTPGDEDCEQAAPASSFYPLPDYKTPIGGSPAPQTPLLGDQPRSLSPNQYYLQERRVNAAAKARDMTSQQPFGSKYEQEHLSTSGHGTSRLQTTRTITADDAQSSVLDATRQANDLLELIDKNEKAGREVDSLKAQLQAMLDGFSLPATTSAELSRC